MVARSPAINRSISMFSSTLPTIVIASRSAVVRGSMTPEVMLQMAWKKSTACCDYQC
jgi:hypothetical protein